MSGTSNGPSSENPRSKKTRKEHDSHSEHEEHEEGEPWLVSYADLMTLLFGFFVLMYTFATQKIDKSPNGFVKVRQEIAAYFTGAADNETDRMKEDATSSLTDAFSPLLSLIGGPTTRGQKNAKPDPKTVFDEKQHEVSSRIMLQEGTILGSISQQMAQIPLGAAKFSGADGINSDSEYVLTFSSARLFEAAVANAELQLSSEGRQILDKLIKSVGSIERPVRVAVEAYRDSRQNKKVLTPLEYKSAFESTSVQSAMVLSYLLEKIGEKSKIHVFAASGYGFLDPSRLDAVVRDRVLVRVSLMPGK